MQLKINSRFGAGVVTGIVLEFAFFYGLVFYQESQKKYESGYDEIDSDASVELVAPVNGFSSSTPEPMSTTTPSPEMPVTSGPQSSPTPEEVTVDSDIAVVADLGLPLGSSECTNRLSEDATYISIQPQAPPFPVLELKRGDAKIVELNASGLFVNHKNVCRWGTGKYRFGNLNELWVNNSDRYLCRSDAGFTTPASGCGNGPAIEIKVEYLKLEGKTATVCVQNRLLTMEIEKAGNLHVQGESSNEKNRKLYASSQMSQKDPKVRAFLKALASCLRQPSPECLSVILPPGTKISSDAKIGNSDLSSCGDNGLTEQIGANFIWCKALRDSIRTCVEPNGFYVILDKKKLNLDHKTIHSSEDGCGTNKSSCRAELIKGKWRLVEVSSYSLAGE